MGGLGWSLCDGWGSRRASLQWQIQDFPDRGGATTKASANLLFDRFDGLNAFSTKAFRMNEFVLSIYCNTCPLIGEEVILLFGQVDFQLTYPDGQVEILEKIIGIKMIDCI